jgi:uncharacterized protein
MAGATATGLPLKFQPDHASGVNQITRQEPGVVWVQAQAHSSHLLLPWSGDVRPWATASFDLLAAEHFDAVVALRPELVLFGSGLRLRFAAPALWRGLIDARIGFETMDTAAACRTFNVLASEGRRVVAALLLEPPTA